MSSSWTLSYIRIQCGIVQAFTSKVLHSKDSRRPELQELFHRLGFNDITLVMIGRLPPGEGISSCCPSPSGLSGVARLSPEGAVLMGVDSCTDCHTVLSSLAMSSSGCEGCGEDRRRLGSTQTAIGSRLVSLVISFSSGGK